MKPSSTKERLQILMDMYNISQSDLARRCDLSRSIVSLYVSGKREPAQDNIFKISQAFNVDPAWVMGYDIPMRPENVESVMDGLLVETAELMNRVSTEEGLRNFLQAFLSLPEDKRKLIENITYSYLPDKDNE